MTTRYQMKEMPDLQGTGEPITYPKMVMTGQTSTRELAEYIAMTSGFSKGVTEGIICELGEALAHEMGMGRSVKIEGLGVFTPALSIYPDKEREQPQESTTKRNARSIYVSGIGANWNVPPGNPHAHRRNTLPNNVWLWRISIWTSMPSLLSASTGN